MQGSSTRDRDGSVIAYLAQKSMIARGIVLLAGSLLLFGFATGCSQDDSGISEPTGADHTQFALEFVKLLAARDYTGAYAKTSKAYQELVTLDQMRTAFEYIVPTDWGAMGPIEIGATMDEWPDKQASDLGWVYVGIGGDVYSEAVSVIVTSENGESTIRKVEFGRP